MGRLAAVFAMIVLTASPALAKHELKPESRTAPIHSLRPVGHAAPSHAPLASHSHAAKHRKLAVTNKRPAHPSGALAPVPRGTSGENGIASMYAARFVGHKTASGERLDRSSLTAAHLRLPFGTRLVVTNKENGRQVVVTVNDRGPHRKGRIIDLSPAAAARLGMTREGLAPVELRVASQN